MEGIGESVTQTVFRDSKGRFSSYAKATNPVSSLYKTGDRFTDNGSEVLLAQIGMDKHMLIVISNGNRYYDTVLDSPSHKISKKEFHALWGTKWKKL